MQHLQVLRLLVRLYEGVPQPDYVDVCQCLMFLDDDKEVATIVGRLLNGSLVGYRVWDKLGGCVGRWQPACW